MTLDAALATRGWGADEFTRASPEFIDAARWMVLAEKAVPVLTEQESIAEATVDRNDPQLADLLRQRVIAINYVEHTRPWLFPEDDDG